MPAPTQQGTRRLTRSRSPARLSEARRDEELYRLYAAVEADDMAAMHAMAVRLAEEFQREPPRPGRDILDEALRVIQSLPVDRDSR